MKFMKFAITILAILLSGCAASGMKMKDMASSIPSVPADKGRVYFFRSSSMVGAAVQPSVTLDGKTVGESKPGGFFFVDATPGSHDVAISTEVEKKLTFTLDKGETKYVRTSISFGVMAGHVIPTVVSAEEAQKELPDLSYTGTAVANSNSAK